MVDFTHDFWSQGKHPVECYELGVSLDQDQIKSVLDKIDDILIAGGRRLRIQNIAGQRDNNALVPGHIEERLELHAERLATKKEGFDQ